MFDVLTINPALRDGIRVDLLVFNIYDLEITKVQSNTEE
jgi:hypothetical protein